MSRGPHLHLRVRYLGLHRHHRVVISHGPYAVRAPIPQTTAVEEDDPGDEAEGDGDEAEGRVRPGSHEVCDHCREREMSVD